MKRYIAALAAIMLTGPAAAGPEKPTLVSLDYCADQFVLALADREQILALSKDATRNFSYLKDKAEGIPQLRAATEDVIALKPDMVVRSWGGDARAMAFYQRFGIRTVQIGYASDLPGALDVTRSVAEQIGQSDKLDALLEGWPEPAVKSERSALYVTPGGISAGNGTMIDSIMDYAGLENANQGTGWTGLPLEGLVLSPPSLMLTAFFNFDDDATDRWSLSRHPVMQRLLSEADVIAMNEARVSCGGWFVMDEVQALRDVLGAER